MTEINPAYVLERLLGLLDEVPRRADQEFLGGQVFGRSIMVLSRDVERLVYPALFGTRTSVRL